MAVVSLGQLAEMVEPPLADTCRALQHEVADALQRYAIAPRRIFAYEVDGYGNQHCMDEANVPNLLALPYLGYCRADDAVYLRTRQTMLSDANPWFFSGRFARGIGGPHTGTRRVWPLAITMQALTSTSDHEIRECIGMLLRTDAGTGFMHEAFDPDHPETYSRPWFAWANSLFGELILRLHRERPAILRTRFL